MRPLLWVIVLAFLLRLWGVFGQGLPHCYFPDEANNVERALALGAKKSLDWEWPNKPALGYYFLLIEYGALYGGGRVVGAWSSAEDFGASYYANRAPFLITGRIFTTLFGVLTLLLVHRLGRIIAGETVGVLAALALALTLGHVESSQQVKMDVPCAFWNAWCALLLVQVMRKGRWRDYIFCGGFAGLGMATKYYPVAMLFPLFCAHLMREPDARARSPRSFLSLRYPAGVFALVFGFFIGSPYSTINGFWQDYAWPQFVWVLRRIGIHLCQGFEQPVEGVQTTVIDGANEGSSLVTPDHTLLDTFWRLLESFVGSEGAGWPLALLAVGGVVTILRSPCRTGLLLLIVTFTLALSMGVANKQVTQHRHLNAVYSFTAILSVLGVHGFVRLLKHWSFLNTDAQRRQLAVGSFFLLLLVPLVRIIQHDIAFTAEEPRNRALHWLEARADPGTVIINDHGRIPFMPNAERCRWAQGRLEVLLRRTKRDIDRVRAEEPPDELDRLIRYLNNQIGRMRTAQTEWRFRAEGSGRYDGKSFDVIDFNHAWMTEELRKRETAASAYNQFWPRSPWGDRFNVILRRIRRSGETSGPVSELSRRVVDEMRRYLLDRYVGVAASRAIRAKRQRGEVFASLEELEEAAQAILVKLLEDLGSGGLNEMPSIVELWARRSPVSVGYLTPYDDARGRRQHRGAQYFVSAKASYDNYEKLWKRQNFPDWAGLYDDLKANYHCWEFNGDDPDPERVIRVWDLTKRVPGKGKCTPVE
ncbi:MAG: hypothetical protein CMJ83_14315 [Planctomycetes bacterium]|nr:hypothetical protein [Planctomycetota bacterium]